MARMCNCASKMLEVSSLEGLDYPEWVLPLSGITLQFYRTVHWAAMEGFILRCLCCRAKELARKLNGVPLHLKWDLE